MFMECIDVDLDFSLLFFKQKTAYEMRISDWSSDVCSSDLTEEGTEHVERLLEAAGLLQGNNLYDIENTQIVHHVNQALKAIVMFKLDTDYIVKDGKVVIIDEFTGRMMDGRRWSDGLHQAVERSEEHTSELQSLMRISYAVFCLKKKIKPN